MTVDANSCGLLHRCGLWTCKCRGLIRSTTLLLYVTFENGDDSLFFLQRCVRDTLSPISIKLYFTQENGESAATVLNVDSTLQADVEVRGGLPD